MNTNRRFNMSINFEHKEDIEIFVSDNLELINTNINEFSKKKHKELIFTKTAIVNFLKNKYDLFVSDEGNTQNLLDTFKKREFNIKAVPDIATSFGLYFSHVKKFYEQNSFSKISNAYSKKLCNYLIDKILNDAKIEEEHEKTYVKTILRPIVEKNLYMTLKGGFSYNLYNVEDGVMTANAGDSAQFLFLARAILAGFNCSNVDVRSSRYDAVIDKNGIIYRVQIKGITGTTASFKARDRGGEGIDPSDASNKGRRVTKDDCDLYVAVDKQSGICYIIPISDIEGWDCNQKSILKLTEYKENWDIINSMEK